MTQQTDPATFLVGGHRLPLRPAAVMGVLNVTPDSFSDGGRYRSRDAALQQARDMVAAGAALIDVGGESTRPGADPVGVGEETDRVLPVIEAIRAELDTPISIDTSKPEVMRAAVAAGASMINDVRALLEPGALEAAASLGVPVCLMHMQGRPRTMQRAPEYEDVCADVTRFLCERAHACEAAGIAAARIVLDPGFGFGKRLQDNLDLLAGLGDLCALGYPVLAGLSRKSMLEPMTGRAVGDRLAGSIALATLAAERGAGLIRAHDVAATVDAVRVVWALQGRPGAGHAE
jgi:dihydropteroate synthase